MLVNNFTFCKNANNDFKHNNMKGEPIVAVIEEKKTIERLSNKKKNEKTEYIWEYPGYWLPWLTCREEEQFSHSGII